MDKKEIGKEFGTILLMVFAITIVIISPLLLVILFKSWWLILSYIPEIYIIFIYKKSPFKYYQKNKW